jgi:hypothetical protein
MRSVCPAQSQKSLACLSCTQPASGVSKIGLRSSALKNKKEKRKTFPISPYGHWGNADSLGKPILDYVAVPRL